MEITGKVISILPPVEGTGKKGAWRKEEFVVSVDGKYPRNVAFSLFNAPLRAAVNDTVDISFDLESREYNGRWYTEAKAWKVVKSGDVRVTERNEEPVYENATDDLPF